MGYNFLHMYKKGREETIIMRHDVESLNKRCDMMLSCCPPMQEIDYSLIQVIVAVRALKASDTPLIIGRIPDASIIIIGDFSKYTECLVTYKHSIFKTIKGQHFRG